MRDLSLTCIALLGLCAGAGAQTPANPSTSPLEAVTSPKTDAPVTVDEKPPAPPDPEFSRIIADLAGSFGASRDGVELRLNAAPIDVTGLNNAVYFEIARADAPATPFRQGVFHLHRFKGELRLRVFDISGTSPVLGETGGTSRAESMAGLWAAPDVFPALTLNALAPNLDVVLTKGASDGAYTGRTPHPFATMRDGAVEMTSEVTIGATEIALTDSGIAPDGSVAWGGGTPTRFKRLTAPPATVTRNDEGLVVITIIAPPAENPKLIENGTVTVNYTGWLTDGTRFDTSRRANRGPYSTRIPGSLIRGWNLGLANIAKGERRRVVVPPQLAYGERGNRAIPPNSTLIFDLECVHIDNTIPPELSQPGSNPAQMVNPHSFQPPARPNPTANPAEKPK